MKLTKKSDEVLPEQTPVEQPGQVTEAAAAAATLKANGLSMNRRAFLRNSGLMTGGPSFLRLP